MSEAKGLLKDYTVLGKIILGLLGAGTAVGIGALMKMGGVSDNTINSWFLLLAVVFFLLILFICTSDRWLFVTFLVVLAIGYYLIVKSDNKKSQSQLLQS